MFTIFLSIFLSKGCARKTKNYLMLKFLWVNTRGYHRMITIENGTFSLVSQRDGKPSCQFNRCTMEKLADYMIK